MTSIRMQVLNQICETPGKTCKWLGMEMGVDITTIRGAIYTLEADRLIRKVPGTKPYAYEPDRIRGIRGKKLPEFVENMKNQQQDEYSRTWKPKRDLVLFFRSMTV